MQFHLTHYDSVTSTMDVARQMAEAGAPEGSVTVADEQTSGRGRSAHIWYSPPAQSLYVSLLLRPALTPTQTGWITMVAALAMRDLIVEIRDWYKPASGAPPSPMVSIKWFNDVLLGGRKVCGILVESSLTDMRVDYAVLGIGLNVNTRFEDAPPDVRARATSLAAAWGTTLDREMVLQRLLALFGARYERLVQTRRSPAPEYAPHVETLGREVHIDTGSERVTGRAVRIADDGALIVQTAQGERRIGFGDVTA
jgi:BirA family biotin operon repressor/biotin-[acetyl-CoA-carboxylase] ligase